MFLYWVDVYTSSVGRIKTNGTMRNDALITSDSFSGVHGFVMDAFTYFWSRPTDKDFIVRARVNSKGTSHFSFRENPVAMEGLYYYQSDKLIPGKLKTCIILLIVKMQSNSSFQPATLFTNLNLPTQLDCFSSQNRAVCLITDKSRWFLPACIMQKLTMFSFPG